jgi:pyridoxal phosphate phosphatase PHOSPHO2
MWRTFLDSRSLLPSPSAPMSLKTPVARQLIVFDFDWSLADQDSDRWVLEVLAPDLRRQMKDNADGVQWTDLVCVRRADSRGQG